MKLAAAALVAIAAVAFAGGAVRQAHGGAATEISDGITVAGVGVVTTVPDRAAFSFTVSSRGKTASDALDSNGNETSRVIAALKVAGVQAADLQTSQISLYPRTSNDGQTIIGYDASNSISARVRDLGQAGDVVDAAVRAGANGVSGPSLFKADRDSIARDGLRAAVANARTKAEVIAAAAGVRLGRVTRVVEGGGNGDVVVVPQSAGVAAGAARTPVEPGTQELQTTVTVTFSIA